MSRTNAHAVYPAALRLLAKPPSMSLHPISMAANLERLTASIPAYLQDLVIALDEVDASARRLVRDLTETQFHWQPKGGYSWSIAQCIEHLAITNSLYVTAMRQAVDEAKRGGSTPCTAVRPGLLSRLFVWNLEPPVKVKQHAPAQIVPDPRRDRRELWLAFTHVEERVRRLMLECADIDVNRTRFVNPLRRGIRFTVGVGFLIVLAHNRRHVWQAERVREAPGFATV